MGASWVRQTIRPELQDQCRRMRANLIEIAVDMDDDAMEAYLEGTEPTRKRCAS